MKKDLTPCSRCERVVSKAALFMVYVGDKKILYCDRCFSDKYPLDWNQWIDKVTFSEHHKGITLN